MEGLVVITRLTISPDMKTLLDRPWRYKLKRPQKRLTRLFDKETYPILGFLANLSLGISIFSWWMTTEIFENPVRQD
jgi:hypothetical protein